jgi:hypothetical protein
LHSLRQQTAVFLNPGHADYVKRITYRTNPDGALAGRLEGVDAGKAFAEDFVYRPAKQP